MYNKKILLDALKKLDKAKAPAKKKDTMFDPTGKGMLDPNYAGKPVVLPTDTLYNPTPYAIKATSDNGIQKFLNPFDETPVHFPGASSIKEEPIMKKGGTKKFSKSLAATNKLMKKNPLLKKKSYKGKTYDPSAMYFQDGGTFEELELTDEEIEEYKKGGYVVEYVDDPSIPELTKAQNGLFLAANAAITSTPATKNTILAAGKGPVPITPVNSPTAKPVSFVPGVEYRYADRPDSSYKLGPNGQILIKNPDTGGQYVPIDDPGGSRRQTLLKGFQTGKTVPIAPPKASKELINKTRVVEPIPTPAPVPQTPPVIETWEPPAEPVMAPVIETAVSTPVSKSSEPKVRYHVEYNPYTRKYEPMSFRQQAELMSLYNRGLPMPENWQPELLDERTRQPIKKQTGGQKPTVYVDPNDPAGRARYQAYQDSLKTYSTNDFLFKDVKQQLGKNFDKFDVINLTVPQLKSIFSHDPNIIKEYFGRGNDPVKGINVKVKPQYYNQRYNNTQFLEYIFPVFAKPTQPVEYKPDPKIVAKQQQLIDAGYKIGKADGIWGPKSQTAWEEFQKTQPVQTNQPQVTPVPQIPSGYNVWTDHLGQPLDPQIYGYAPSNNPRQISQHADTYALKRANEFYTKIGATPWATTGNKLLTDPSKPYFSKQAATNALEQTAQQIGVEVSQLQVIKAPAGYPGYVIIQTLPQQRYGGSFQIGGQLSSEEFAKRKAAYEKVTGRKLEQPKTFKPSEKARQATLDKYNQLPVVQSQPSETIQQSAGLPIEEVTRRAQSQQIREQEEKKAKAAYLDRAAENYMKYHNDTYGSDYGFKTKEQALQEVSQSDFGGLEKYYNMYNPGPKNEELSAYEEQGMASRTWDVITNPFTAFKYSVQTEDFRNMPQYINKARMAGYDVDPDNLVGNAINTFANPFDVTDKVVRNTAAGDYEQAMLEALRMAPVPLAKYVPTVLRGANKFLSYAPIKQLPWLTGHGALNTHFAYETFKPEGFLDKSYQGFKEEDYGKGVENALWGTLGIAPFIRPGMQTVKAINELRTPGSMSIIPGAGKYSFAYKSPMESGLLVGNPNLGEAAPAFEKIVNPLSRFTKEAGLGEFKILKQNQAVSNVKPNVFLGDMTRAGQAVEVTTPALMENLPQQFTGSSNIPSPIDDVVKSFIKLDSERTLPVRAGLKNTTIEDEFSTLVEMNKISNGKGVVPVQSYANGKLILDDLVSKGYTEVDEFIKNKGKISESAIKELKDNLKLWHNNNIIHGDLKPNNAFYNPKTQEIKLIDPVGYPKDFKITNPKEYAEAVEKDINDFNRMFPDSPNAISSVDDVGRGLESGNVNLRLWNIFNKKKPESFLPPSLNAEAELARANADALAFSQSPHNKVKLQEFRPNQDFTVTNTEALFHNDPVARERFAKLMKDEPAFLNYRSTEGWQGAAEGNYGARNFGDMDDLAIVNRHKPQSKIYNAAIHETGHSRSVRLPATKEERAILDDAWQGLKDADGSSLPVLEAEAVQGELRMLLGDKLGKRVYTKADEAEIKTALEKMIADNHPYMQNINDFDISKIIKSLNKIGLASVVGIGTLGADSFMDENNSDLSEASVSALFAFLLKKPATSKFSKDLKSAFNLFKKGGLDALKPNHIKALKNEIKSIVDQIGRKSFTPYLDDIGSSLNPRTVANTPRQLPGSPNAISSVDDLGRGLTQTPQPWQMQELPGLHLKSTMEGEAISKIIEPKTGLINTEQALAIIGKESGGADKVALIRQALGDNIPKKMDYNEFRKVVQDQLIPLERQLSKKTSWYGINRIGYGDPTDIIVNAENKRITPVQPLENQTLILSNKSKFGRGSSAHSNPEETLGHMHFLRDPEHPNIGIATQIQSDAFQGTHRIMPKSKENLLKDIETGWATNEGIENFTQKQLLDKNHQERFLQEFMDYAGKRGDLDYIAIPKPETAAKVQGYSKGEPSREFINSQTNLRNDIVDALEKHGENSIEFKTLNDKYNKLLKDNSLGNYSPEHQTILKKYSEYEKIAKKLGWKTEDITIKGNTYTKIQIPDKFKKGKGEIKAFGLAPFIGIGAAGALGAASQYQEGGQIQEKAIELELTPEEIEWYKSQGYVVEDLPNAQVGGTPSEIWKQYTNTSWSEAKKQGLTDGSAKQNIELANRLLAGEFGEAKVSYEDYQNSRATYDKMVVDKVMRGATLDDLVSQKVGTRSGLINRFPDLFGTQTSTQSKTLPDKASAKKETDNKRSSAPAQEPVITPPVVKQPEQQEPLSLQELREKIKGLKKNTNVTSPTRLLQEYLSNPIKYRKELEEFQKANQNNKPSLHPSLYMKESDFNSSPVAPVPLSRGNTPQPIPGGLGSQITNIGRPGFVNQDLLRFTEEERQRHEEEAKGRVKQYDAGVLGNLLNPAGQAFTSLDTHKGLDNLKKDFNDYTQYAKRFAVKEGLADVEEEKVVIKKQKPVKPLPAKNKIDSYYNEIATVADKYTKSDSLLSYRNQWDNSKGFEYIATPVKKDRDPNGVYKNVKGVAHFLLDASANPIKPYSHEFNKSFLQKAKDNNDWIPTFQTVDASSDRVRLVYKKPDELTDADNVYAPLRQMKFSEINFSNTKTPKGFKTGIKEVTKNDGEGTYLIFKNRDGYSRFSGGSVVFIFKDKSGNTIVRDFAGSLNQIEKEGLDIQKQYNIKSEDLTIGYHDVGSFSAKPKANSKGELKTSQWNGFNPEAWTGGALLIPND